MKPHVLVLLVGMFITPVAAILALYGYVALAAILTGSLATAVGTAATYLSSQGQ